MNGVVDYIIQSECIDVGHPENTGSVRARHQFSNLESAQFFVPRS